MDMKEILNESLIGNAAIESAVKTILISMGEDPERDGLKRTPYRVSKAYAEWFSGYKFKPEDALNRTFESDYDGIVIVKDIKFYSHCEHHITPFLGKVHIAYIPNGRVSGLDKFIKLVEIYARRLQTQEQLTYQIAEGIQNVLKPKGVGVQISAIHFCIMSRETRNQDSITTTTRLLGDLEKSGPKQEFFQSIQSSSIF